MSDISHQHQPKPYPEYKDSGQPWLGEVPAHWEMRRNGRMFAHRVETGFPDLPVREVSLKTGVRVRNLDSAARKQFMSDFTKYKRACAGDIAYNMMRMWQGAVGVAPVDGLVSPAYVVARPYEATNSTYFASLFRTSAYMNEVNNSSRGIVLDRNRLYWDEFKQMSSPFPPPDEQAAIVRFLGAADRRVNRLVRAKRRLIELLTEQKQALITHAVTRGLNPNAKLKPSGIDWLGDVPEHWEVRAVWQLFDLGRGQVTSNQYVGDHPGPYPLYSSQTENDGAMGSIDTYMLDGEYLTWTTDGAHAGTVFHRRGRFNCTNVCGTLKAKHPQRLYLPFMRWAVASVTKRQVRLDINPKLMNNMMARIRVCVPPYQEQASIGASLERVVADNNITIHRTQREIELVCEYGTRLVTDVVTGKRDVRHLAPADTADVEDRIP